MIVRRYLKLNSVTFCQVFLYEEKQQRARTYRDKPQILVYFKNTAIASKSSVFAEQSQFA